MNWIRVQMRINCTECGSTMPVNGPWRAIHCPNCQADIEYADENWKDVLESLREDGKEKMDGPLIPCVIFDAFDTKLLSAKARPRCPRCRELLPRDGLEAGGTVACPGCGMETAAGPPPEWLRKLAPSLSLLFNASPRDEAGGPELSGIKPVMFSCLQCGSPLRVDGTSRILTCDACGTDCYLPDPLWLRLHPAQVMARWYVAFGKPRRPHAGPPSPSDGNT